MNERLQRIAEDERRERIWTLGGILWDASRELRIRAVQDWPTLLSPTLARYPMPRYGRST